MTDTFIVQNFKERIEAVTKLYLDSYYPKATHYGKSEKFIHDNIWGTTYYRKWEIALIDSLLLQRLRNIHQTGLAYLVFPTATHTRFDHTLGVLSIVEKIVESINKKENATIGSKERYSLRLAAIFHDIGHGPFSHITEEVYEDMDVFREIKKYINDKFSVNPKPHEIMSYLIISSEYFKNWFNERIIQENLMPPQISKHIDLEKIAGYIIGYSDDPNEKYLADIINGPIDADKLDYLARDAKFSGLSIGYDLDRYFKTIDLYKVEKDGRSYLRLSIPLSGVNSLEQMIISKMNLYSSLYHHQKVRCTERMFVQFCKQIIKGEVNRGNLKIDHPVDFLYYVDSDLINFYKENNPFKKEARRLYSKISQRNLMNRALIISRPFILNLEASGSTKINFNALINDCKNKNELLRKEIVRESNKLIEKDNKNELRISEYDVIIDVPKQPSMEETLGTTVPIDMTILGKERDKDVEIDRIFPIKAWAEGYANVKWRGHIFTYKEAQEYVNQATRQVISKKYKILFSKNATVLCKIDYSMIDDEKQLKLRLGVIN
jgi:uncharacterized protein